MIFVDLGGYRKEPIKSSCLACPDDCRQCSHDEGTCECYEHMDMHPDDAKKDGET